MNPAPQKNRAPKSEAGFIMPFPPHSVLLHIQDTGKGIVRVNSQTSGTMLFHESFQKASR